MASTAELMREVHRLRKFARDLQEQIDRAPEAAAGTEGQAHAPGRRRTRKPGGDQKTQDRGPRKGSNAQDDAHADRQVPGPAQRGRLQEGIRRPPVGDRRRPREVRQAGRGDPDGPRRDRRAHGQGRRTRQDGEDGEGRIRPLREGLRGAAGDPEEATRRDARPAETGRGGRAGQGAVVVRPDRQGQGGGRLRAGGGPRLRRLPDGNHRPAVQRAADGGVRGVQVVRADTLLAGAAFDGRRGTRIIVSGNRSLAPEGRRSIARGVSPWRGVSTPGFRGDIHPPDPVSWDVRPASASRGFTPPGVSPLHGFHPPGVSAPQGFHPPGVSPLAIDRRPSGAGTGLSGTAYRCNTSGRMNSAPWMRMRLSGHASGGDMIFGPWSVMMKVSQLDAAPALAFHVTAQPAWNNVFRLAASASTPPARGR